MQQLGQFKKEEYIMPQRLDLCVPLFYMGATVNNQA